MSRIVTGDPLRRRLRARLGRRSEAAPLLAAVRSTDAELWVVGGFVRDAALGRPSEDLDLVGGRGAARLVRALAEAWQTRGFRFRRRGVTTWRFDVDGRHVDLVDASRRGLAADLARRDLTVNAVAWQPEGGRLVDPLGGLRDLRAGRLRPTSSQAFREDPLRALRLARLLAQLPDFRATPSARRAAAEVAAPAARTAPERQLAELDRLLIAAQPRRGLEAMDQAGLVVSLLPELAAMARCTAGADRPDVWRHTLDAVERSCGPRRLPGATLLDDDESWRVLRWSLLLHDVAKPETLDRADDGRPTFHGHETLGARRADALLGRLRAPRATRRRVGRLIGAHLRPGHLADAGPTPRGLGRLIREVGDDLPLLTFHAACDALASGSPAPRARWLRLRRVLSALLERWRLAGGERQPPLIDGRTVMRLTGLAPGPEVGALLEQVAEARAAGEIATAGEAERWLRRRQRAEGG